MVKLAGIILALLIEILVSAILIQLLKATSGKKTAWPGFHRFVAAGKLHYLVKLTYLGMLALIL